mgnify:CR=1 FL=1
MVLLGVIVNTLAIILGAGLGQIFSRINEQMKTTVMQVIGLAVLFLGIEMAFSSSNFVLVLFSLVIGASLGEWFHLEERLERLGSWLEAKVGQRNGNIAKAFVTTTLIYCVGAMAVVGSLNSGLRLDHDLLYTKSLLDGFTAIIFSSTLGIGVVFSSIPVFIYQGTLALLATQINLLFTSDLINLIVSDLTATGGILIMAIGLNILELTNIKVGNLLPALLVVILLSGAFYSF